MATSAAMVPSVPVASSVSAPCVASSVSAPCVITATAQAPLPTEAQVPSAADGPPAVSELKASDVEQVCSSSSSGSSSKEPPEEKVPPKRNFVAPKVWMVSFGVVLAICAGAVDVVTFRNLAVFTSHVTGTVARVGMRLEGVTTGLHDTWDVFHSSLLVGSFIFGAFLCGLVVPRNQVHFGGKNFYGIALLGNSFLLVVATFISPRNPVEGPEVTQTSAITAGCLAAMACGLQNAMCTMHFGAVVRTTHVTGTSTDIGSTAGRAAMILLRKGCRYSRTNDIERVDLQDDASKLQVLAPIFAGFLVGTIFGAFLDSVMGIHALLVPAAITGSTGFTYLFFRTQMKKQLRKLEERRLKDELSEMDAALHRAHSYLESYSASDRQDLGGLDDLIGHSLEVMHDVEATLSELYANGDGSQNPPMGLSRSRTF